MRSMQRNAGRREILACSPMAVRATKEAVLRGLDEPVEAALKAEWSYPSMLAMLASQDAIEGPARLAGKRAALGRVLSMANALDQAANAGTSPVRDAHRFDEGGTILLDARQRRRLCRPVDGRAVQGGQSNPTYRLVTPARCYVLRRKPRDRW